MSRLLIITRSNNPHGGADRIIADLCHHLPDHGWDISLGLAKGLRFNLPELYQHTYPDLPIMVIDGSLGTRTARIEAIRKAILTFRPDTVLSMRIFDAYEAVARIKNSGDYYKPRLIVGVRSFEESYLDDVRRYREVIDGCITSGKLIANACIDYCGMDQARVFSIAGGITKPVPCPIRTTTGNPIQLLYAGRLVQEQKRVLDLIPFVHELTKRKIVFQLNIAGEGPEKGELERQLEPWIGRKEVCFHGWVDPGRLNTEFYPKADVFVHFAAWEGVTIAPREAMSHGVVPVISRFTGLISEGQFVHGQNALTFPVGDTYAAVDRIIELIEDQDLFARLCLAATRSQQGEYSATGAIQKWDVSLRSILELEPRIGTIPDIHENLPGRMSRWGLPAGLQSRIRTVLNLPVRHTNPGSEWPTASGLITESTRAELSAYIQKWERQIS